MSDYNVGVTQKKSDDLSIISPVKKRVLVFSPDADLAQVLLLNLEDRFQIIREHCLERFEEAILNMPPDLVLIDMYTFSDNIIKQLNIMRRTVGNIPVIAMRAYVPLTPEADKLIEELSDVLFYKPVDVELVTQAIEDLLKQSSS
jgi:DNA-binding NtrC family response regulator